MPESYGRYQLLDRIGVGGMGEVFRARLEVPAGAEKILAVKRILPGVSAEPESLRLFVNEAKIALPLTHGNIVSVFDFGEVAGSYFLAMEYIHGQNLQAVLHRCRQTATPVPIAAALHVANEVAKGLAYAHGYLTPQGERAGVVHLDVSPQNVLVSYDGAVKLTDFGIARARAQAGGAGPVRGKAAYLAPEQLDGGPVDARTDLYALGCVLYEMLTGVRAFEGATETETVELVKGGEPKPPSALRPELGPYDELVMRCLEREPGRRWQKAAELQVALQQALFGIAPDYGPAALSDWMRELFAWELLEQLAEGNAARDRLLSPLSKATVAAAATRDIRAVPMGAAEAPPRKRLAPALAAVGLVLAGAIGGGAWLALREPPPDPAVAPPPAGKGRVSMHSWPSSTVFLDGKRLPGATPLREVEVPAGEHKVLFVHPELGLKKQVDVVIEPGTDRTISVKLER